MQTHQLSRDFNRLAQLPEPNWSHNIHYEGRILDHLGSSLDYVLEVGCGKGRLCKELAKISDHTIGIDIAPRMIRAARLVCNGQSNTEFICDDYMDRRFPRGQFDAIVSVATIHHLDLAAFLRKAKRELVTGGKLIIVDLHRNQHWVDHFRDIAVRASSTYMGLKHNGTVLAPRTQRRMWQEHSKKETYMTLSEIHKTAVTLLPGFELSRLFYWRYWLYWEKQ